MASRFGSKDADEFTLQQQNVETKAATIYAVKVLTDFMLEKNYDREIGTMDIVVLNGILQDSYVNVRTNSGDYYSKSSLVAIRQGIRRYLQEPPYNRHIDIVTDMKLKKANDAFKSMLKKCRQGGKGVVQHKKSIQSGTFPFIMC
jgi:hypothetical protein